MHKPSSVRPLSILSPPPRRSSSLSLSLSSPPRDPARQFTTRSHPVGAYSFLFRLLPLSATHLYSVNPFHCENVVLQSALPLTPPLPLPSSPAPFLAGPLVARRASAAYLFLCAARGRSASLSAFSSSSLFLSPPLSLSLSLSLSGETPAQPSFLSLHSRSSLTRRTALLDESSRSTSGYLTPLINGRRKTLGFGLFRGTRPSSEARKVKWSLSLFTFAREAGSGDSRCNDTKSRDRNSGCIIIPDVVSRVYRRCSLVYFISLLSRGRAFSSIIARTCSFRLKFSVATRRDQHQTRSSVLKILIA